MSSSPSFVTTFRVAFVVALYQLLCLPLGVAAQNAEPAARPEATPGPAVRGFGPTSAVPKPDFATPTDQVYRMVLDVAQAPEADDARNPRIETAAGFLNMHARAGVPRENEPDILRLTNQLFASDDPDLQREGEDRQKAMLELGMELYQLFDKIIQDRRRTP